MPDGIEMGDGLQVRPATGLGRRCGNHQKRLQFFGKYNEVWQGLMLNDAE
jgi:hypothetical protein